MKRNMNWKQNMFGNIFSATMRLISLLLMVLLGMFVSLPASAQSYDLMLVMDSSSSLDSSDATGERFKAVNYLMGKISGGTVVQDAGLVLFAYDAQVAVPLGKTSSVVTSISNSTSPPATMDRGWTAIGAGISAATQQLTSHGTPGASKIMMVFTDGMNNIGSDPVVEAANAKAKGITVYVIALGSSAATYAQPIADAGGGRVLVATDPSQLVSLFANSGIVPISTPTEVIKAQTQAVSAQVQRATTIQQAVTIINVLSSIANPRAAMGPQRFALGGKNGMAAGEGASQWNGWMNLSRAQVANTFTSAIADTRFDGDVDNWIGGVDYAIDKNLVVGASVGYDKTNLDTHYNNGNFSSKGLMIAPHISYQINSMFSVDAVIGYADGDSDLRSNIFGIVTAKQDFTRNFAAVNLSAVKWFDSWQVTGKMSYINAEEKLKDYTDSTNAVTLGQNNRLEQFRLGGQVGYWTNGIMPYVGLTYINDISAPSSGLLGVSESRDAYSAAFGINVFAKNLMGSLSYTTERGRSNSKNNILMASMSYRF